MGLVKLYTMQNDYQAARNLLQSQIDTTHNNEYMHTKLATVCNATHNRTRHERARRAVQVYAAAGMASDALSHYQHALTLNATYAPAIRGIEQLDAHMKQRTSRC